MAWARYCYSEVLPFAALFTVECTNVGLNTLFKAATLRGLSYHVFMVYSFALSTLVLTPVAYLFHRKSKLPPCNLPFVFSIIILGILGFTAQMLGFKGIEYATPTLSSAMNNLTPACTFALALIFRMEKLALRRLSSQAKIIGTVISISGAFVVILYKGPTLIKTVSQSNLLDEPSSSTQSNWIIGGGLFAAQAFLCSIWYILQARAVKQYPAELIVVVFYNLSLTIVSTPVCFFAEPNLNAWKINTRIGLITILYSGIIGSGLGTAVILWGINLKGPVYAALFKPWSIAIAAIMGVIFLGDSFYCGSLVGSIVIAIGYYIVIWGNTREGTRQELEEHREPLLQ
ncbi:hypothetical protein RJ640_018425 [Escallonia rubra]|uniref:WAT1-related protein n=1 Tax=Escallonia rubra TaxID=112253 RepID=A0AA88R4F5_9ASTE|nr:hypothetical protein RJ640_018425 [Escallonia rubra]